MHTADMHILGERQANIITETAVTKHLTSGELSHALAEHWFLVGQGRGIPPHTRAWDIEIAHMMKIVSNSRLGFQAVQRLLQ